MAERGRPKNIESPEILWQHFQEYKKEIKSTPILVHDFVGKFAEEVYRKRDRPLTLEGFENYCAEHNVIKDLGDYFKNKEDRYKDFAPICSRIKNVIRQDQIEGGMAGIYNPSITQRLNGLVDKQEQEVRLPGVTKEDLIEIANKING